LVLRKNQIGTGIYSIRRIFLSIGRRELENNEGYELKESQNFYNRVFDPEKCRLWLKYDHIWRVF
jgi:hypothetical protein